MLAKQKATPMQKRVSPNPHLEVMLIRKKMPIVIPNDNWKRIDENNNSDILSLSHTQ